MTKNEHTAFLRELELLQLPCKRESLIQFGWVDDFLAENSLSSGDAAAILSDDVKSWSQGEEPSDFVWLVIDRFLAANRIDRFSLNGEQYLALFSRISAGTRRWKGPDWNTTKLLLSRSRLVGYLWTEEAYSASQISRVLSASNRALRWVPFQAIKILADEFSAPRGELTPLECDAYWIIEEDLGDELFADSTLEESCAIADYEISRIATGLKVSENLLSLIKGYHSREGISWNYLQMLYWLSLVLERYDHPAGRLYEFSPRGQLAEHVFSNFPAATRNPILNNAKAVASLDKDWALNRGHSGAHGLVELVEELEALPYAASRQMARILRAWIVRTTSLFKDSRTQVEIIDPNGAFHSLVEAVCNGETYTHGVIEQRVVDALGLLAYGGQGWKPRGLGDSVNASNISRDKLGDIEFVCIEELRAIAVEAHGGRLTAAYVNSHMHSLSRIIERRLSASWSEIADASEWTVDVVFVAHSIAAGDFPINSDMAGVKVNYSYIDYFELRRSALEKSSMSTRSLVFKEWVLKILNSSSVRQDVREKADSLMGRNSKLVAFEDEERFQ